MTLKFWAHSVDSFQFSVLFCLSYPSSPTGVLLVTMVSHWLKVEIVSPVNAMATRPTAINALEVRLWMDIFKNDTFIRSTCVCMSDSFIYLNVFFMFFVVCKNTLEPGDTDTDETCQGKYMKKNIIIWLLDMELALLFLWGHLWHISYLCVAECDSCAQTLLNDLEKLDDELGKIKARLDNASASASSQDRLKKLEKAVSDTKVTCHFSVAISPRPQALLKNLWGCF